MSWAGIWQLLVKQCFNTFKMSKTQVINVRKSGCLQQDTVYIGRQNFSWKLSRSKWANPFKIHQAPSYYSREQVCEMYEKLVRDSPQLWSALPELVGKRLACWCFPKECHGDRLIKLMRERKLIDEEGYASK